MSAMKNNAVFQFSDAVKPVLLKESLYKTAI